jgi:4-diphosphocytidyl-2-C-methyl-D-erythritol kinase
MIVFPNCKINLGLHILQKRSDGFHDLETVFYPISWQDALEVVQNPVIGQDLEFTTSGLPAGSLPEENTCVQAYKLLKKDFPALPSLRMHLHKVIPMGAGLGGGSSDGAFTLTLLNKKFNLGITEDQLINYALQLGSDCPFFIRNRPSYATGRGELLQDIAVDLSEYKTVVINPSIHVPTGKAFERIVPNKERVSIRDIIRSPVKEWKDTLKNDFEDSVFADYPEIRHIKEQLYRQGAVYASMSGSGSSVYGVFEKNKAPQLAFPSQYLIKEVQV